MEPKRPRRWKVALVGWGALLLGLSAPLGGAFAIPAFVLAVAGLIWLWGNHEHDLAKRTLQFTLGLAFMSLAAYGFITWFRYGKWTEAVRAKVERVRCHIRLGSIAQWLTIYAEEGDGRLPDAANWCDTLCSTFPRVLDADIFRCSQSVADAWKPYVFFIGGLKALLGGPALPRCTYGFNAKVSRAKFKDLPPDVVLAFGTHGGWNQHGGASDVVARHRGYAMVVFADAHIEMRPREQLAELRWEP